MKIPLRFRFACHVVLICMVWYTVSSAGSIVNKMTLQDYPYPLSVALTSLVSIPIYSAPLLRHWNLQHYALPWGYTIRYLVPISIGKAFAVGSAYFSLWKVPVSYASTVKATMPLFAVFAARVVLGERQTTRVYCSLIPVVAGVVIASATELSFNLAGLISALLSTATYSILNVFVKKVLKDTDVHPMKLLAINAQLAAVFFFPIWFLRDATSMWTDFTASEATRPLPDLRFLVMLTVSGMLSFMQNLCAFTLIHKLTALSYAVTNATKRITVISVSLLTLHNPVTGANLFGMGLAVLGVFLYNRAKQTMKEERHELPMTLTHATLSDASLLIDPSKKYRQRRGVFVDNNANYKRLSADSSDGIEIQLDSSNDRQNMMERRAVRHL